MPVESRIGISRSMLSSVAVSARFDRAQGRPPVSTIPKNASNIEDDNFVI
jgi:hypothetical protein